MSSHDPLQELPELQELRDALSFPTSPDFSARVRRQVATKPVRSRFFGAQTLAVAAAVVVAAIGVVTAVRGRRVERVQVGRPTAVDAAKPAFGAARDGRGGGLETQVAPPGHHRRATNALANPFRTIVPDDQRRALDSLLAAMRGGRATVPPTDLDEELNDVGQRVPRALVIEPMKLELLAGTPGEPNKDPVKDPKK